jgi:hypothetical protein
MFAYGAYLCKIFVFLNYKSIYKLIMTVKKYHQSDFTNENILFFITIQNVLKSLNYNRSRVYNIYVFMLQKMNKKRVSKRL